MSRDEPREDQREEARGSPDKLVYMANQIGRFFAHQGGEKASAAIADHLRKFWDPRMRARIVAHVAAGGGGLDPLVLDAVKRLPGAAGSSGPRVR